MTLSQLRYFCTLAHTLHYTRAAEELHIAQPSLSYSISELEKELDVKLFERVDRKVTLTNYGAFFLPYVESALATLSEGTDALGQMAGTSYQIVRLGYFHSISASLIPQLIKELYEQEKSDSLRFQFTEAGTFDIFSSLKSNKLDFAFCIQRDDTVESVPVLRQPLYLVVPRNHPLASRSEVTMEDIRREPFVMLDENSSLRGDVDALFKAHDMRPNVMFVVRECNAALQYIALNFCVSILPQVPATDLEKVALIPIRENGALLDRVVYFSWVSERPLPAPLRRVRDYIVGHYALPGN
ncbi:MAG: LysR family transcriptional regulator [Firmicutes bacterium]|nr:LysR family transcriptional regulator [Bacillota bacterium]